MRRNAGRARLRLRIENSLLLIPCVYLVVAVGLAVATARIDRHRGWSLVLDEGPSAARDILTSTATGMIAFTGFVLAGVLVVVQFAAGQYSPRLVLWFRRDRLVKHAIGCFLASFIYSVVALGLLDRGAGTHKPDLTVLVALILLAGSAVLFVALLQRVIDGLRPRAIYRAVSRDGIAAARAVFPVVLGQGGEPDESWRAAEPRAIRLPARPGVVVGFDQEALVRAAGQAGVTVELVPAVGEFVDPGEEVLRVHGDGPFDDAALLALVVISAERNVEQDPAFAMRIVVDTAIHALSPAVNDPTTGTQGIDTLELIVRELAWRDLELTRAGDGGAVRLMWRAPAWEDFLDLAFDEIRHYGASSLQVCRRLRAALEDLRDTTDPVRHAAIEEHLRRLDATVRATFAEGVPERELARTADRMGLGLSRP